jgi:hypothetical protein
MFKLFVNNFIFKKKKKPIVLTNIISICLLTNNLQ